MANVSSIIFVFTLALSSSSMADWKALVEIDDFTDEEIRAVVYEDEQVRLQFNLDEAIIAVKGMEPVKNEAMFVYVSSHQGLFEPNTTLEWRVDQHPVKIDEPNDSEYLKTNAYSWSPSTLKLMRWGWGSGMDKCAEPALEFFGGSTLKGRYYVSKMGRQTFSISFNGMRDAFKEAFANHRGVQTCLEMTQK